MRFKLSELRRSLPAGSRRPYKNGRYERVKLENGQWRHVPKEKGTPFPRRYTYTVKGSVDLVEKSVLPSLRAASREKPVRLKLDKQIIADIRKFPPQYRQAIGRAFVFVAKHAAPLLQNIFGTTEISFSGLRIIKKGRSAFSYTARMAYVEDEDAIHIYRRNLRTAGVQELESMFVHELGHYLHKKLIRKSARYASSHMKLFNVLEKVRETRKGVRAADVVCEYSMVKYGNETELFSTAIEMLARRGLMEGLKWKDINRAGKTPIGRDHLEWAYRILRGENPNTVTWQWINKIERAAKLPLSQETKLQKNLDMLSVLDLWRKR